MIENTSDTSTQDQGRDDGRESALDLTDKKVDVALAQLSVRYTALHYMRERSMQFTIWILGLGLALVWLLLSEIALTKPQTLVLLFILIVIPYASHLFLRGIRIGFENNMAIVRRLEEALLLLEPGVYLETKPILDQTFAGEKSAPPKYPIGRIKHALKCTGHFHTLNFLLITVFLLLFLLTLANPCGQLNSPGPNSQTAEQSSGK